MSAAVWCSELLRPRRSSVLRDALPRAPRLAVRDMQQAGDRSLRDGHVPQVPPRALRLHVLPAPAQQGHLQGAEQQAVLPAVFSPSVQLRAFTLPSRLSPPVVCAKEYCCPSDVAVERNLQISQRLGEVAGESIVAYFSLTAASSCDFVILSRPGSRPCNVMAEHNVAL